MQKHTVVRHLNPELDKTVGEIFRNPQGISVFLAYRAGKQFGDGARVSAEAERIFADRRDRKVRELVRTNEDLRALLRVISTRMLEGMPVEGLPDADRDRQSFERITARLQSLRAGTGGTDAAAVAAEIRALDEEYAAILRKYHTQAAKSKEAAGIRLTNMQYTGGVSMDPRLFSVKRAASSPAIEKIRAASRSASTQGGGSGWIRSGNRPPATGASAPPAAVMPGKTGTAAGNQRAPGAPASGATATPRGRPAVPPAPASTTAPSGVESPGEMAVAAPRTAAMRTIVLPPEVTPGGAPIVGRLGARGADRLRPRRPLTVGEPGGPLDGGGDGSRRECRAR